MDIENFITPEKGFELLKKAYVDAENSSGEWISSVTFSSETPFGLIIQATTMFLIWDWDFEEDGVMHFMDEVQGYETVVIPTKDYLTIINS